MIRAATVYITLFVFFAWHEASAVPNPPSGLRIGTPTTGGNKFYVRAGATGANNGLDWNNAFSSLPATLNRGTTYYIADGNYPGYMFDDPVSGTQVISIKKAILSDHGTGTGWNDSYGDGVAKFGSTGFSSSYWDFDGQRGGGYGSWKTNFGFLIEVSQPTSGVGLWIGSEVQQVSVKHFEVIGNGGDGDGTGNANDLINLDRTASNIQFSHAYLHDAGRTLIFNAADNVRFEQIYGGKFESTAGQHSEIASIWKDLSGVVPVRNVVFANCIWSHMEGTGGIIMDGEGLEVYGNVFFRPANAPASFGAPNGAIGTWTASKLNNSKIYNNTFINLGGALPLGFVLSNSGLSGNVVYNNIFYNSPNVSFQNVSNHDYNQFINSDCVWSDPNCSSEAHVSISTVDPFMELANENFRLRQGSAAGLVLQSPYNSDASGLTRGGDAIWDRGAYEFIAGQ